MAQEEAERFHHAYIGTEHLLLGLLRESKGLAAKGLNDLGVDLSTVRSAIESVLGSNERSVVQQIIPTSRVKMVIEISFEEARRLGDNHVGTEHLLFGLLIEGEGIAAHVLGDLGANLEAVRKQLSRLSASGEGEVTDEGRWQGRPAYLPRRPGGGSGPDDRGATMLGEVITRAFGLASERQEMLGTEHLLLALVEQASTTACDILERHGLTRSAIESILDEPPSKSAATSPP
jgi:ATP-dependent Clp protease ATP-binding subunit ClpA